MPKSDSILKVHRERAAHLLFIIGNIFSVKRKKKIKKEKTKHGVLIDAIQSNNALRGNDNIVQVTLLCTEYRVLRLKLYPRSMK